MTGPIEKDFDSKKDLLRMITCGSVDDGKSTLIGRLLHDSKQIYDDHLAGLDRDSKRVGSAGEEIDFSLLLDGLKAEREQGITIDVAYRYFSSQRRKYIIADCPGHEQYTRNMVTGGSTADLAVVLIDATKGVLEQTKRHSFICSLLNIRHIVVAINKIDLVNYDEATFERICADFNAFSARLAIHDIHFIPISALKGENVVERSEAMPWYQGSALLHYLDTVHIASERNLIDLRFPVQYVIRQERGFRGYCGTLVSGLLRPGANVVILPSGKKTRIKSVLNYDGEMKEAQPPLPITVTVEDDIDISRGDMIAHPRNMPRVSSTFDANLVWMSETPLSLTQSYIVKLGTSEARARVSKLRYRFDINSLHRQQAETLSLNEIGRVRISSAAKLSFDAYTRNRDTGSFIIIDAVTNATVGAGMILDRFIKDDSDGGLAAKNKNLKRRDSGVRSDERMERLQQRAATLWLTGLPRSGKTTLGLALERELFNRGYTVNMLDGENLRLGLNKDLDFRPDQRHEATRRTAQAAKICNDAGLITIAATISPETTARRQAREIIGEEQFLEVYLCPPQEACEARDTEGLYARARAGEISDFTGIDSPYDPPENADLSLDTNALPLAECMEKLIQLMSVRGIIDGSN